jgi:hypothetical protein
MRPSILSSARLDDHEIDAKRPRYVLVIVPARSGQLGSMNHSNSLRAYRFALPMGALTLLATFGCSSSSSSSSSTEDSGTTFDDASTANDTGGSTPDSGGGGDDSSSTTMTTSLPFYVSDQFIPSGFMNDPTGITLSSGANGGATCPTRAPSMGGDCYVIQWASTGPAWAGVYWQYPSNNWGTEPGLTVASGATSVTFYARGDVGGETVTFKAGGINSPISTTTGAYGDTFTVSSPTEVLTTDWQQYSLSLQGTSYEGGVLGGFCWVANETDAGNGNIKFYVDDLQWQ